MSVDNLNVQSQGLNHITGASTQPNGLAGANKVVTPVATDNNSTESVQESEVVQGAGLSAQQLKAAVEKMNTLMVQSNRALEFSVDDSSEKVVIKVMDRETEEIVRQIPSEETLKFSEFLEGMVGLIFDQKA